MCVCVCACICPGNSDLAVTGIIYIVWYTQQCTQWCFVPFINGIGFNRFDCDRIMSYPSIIPSYHPRQSSVIDISELRRPLII